MAELTYLRLFRQAKKLSLRAFAQATGMVFSAVSDFETGKRKLSYKNITTIIAAFPNDFIELTSDHKISLLERLENEEYPDLPREFIKIGLQGKTSTALEYLEGPQRQNLILFVRNQKIREFVESEVNTTPLMNPEFYNVVTDIARPENYVVFEMQGRSMADLILDRSLLLAEKCPLTELEYITNGIFAFIIRNELIIRRVKENTLSEPFITLHPNNAEFGAIQAQRSDIKGLWKVKKIISQDLT